MLWSSLNLGKIRFMPPQLREIGFHVENHATQWHGFQHEIQLREIVVAWIQLTLESNTNREVFMKTKNPEVRLIWLKRKIRYVLYT